MDSEHFDESFVVVLSDANFDRYGIRPENFGKILNRNENVNAFVIFKSNFLHLYISSKSWDQFKLAMYLVTMTPHMFLFLDIFFMSGILRDSRCSVISDISSSEFHLGILPFFLFEGRN